jgi:PAS domain S-box-containing protein
MHRKRLFSTGNPQSFELRMLRTKSNYLWVRMQATLAQYSDGLPACRIVISDISDLKNAEIQKEKALADLQKSESRYLAIIEEQTELVCRYLPDGRLSFVNEAYVRYFGQKRQDIMDCNYIPNIPASDLPLIYENLAKITPQTPLAEFRHQVIMPDGTRRWQYWIHRGIYTKDGSLLETQAVGRDITPEYAAQQERERLLSELASKNEELERFTYAASHDLKGSIFTIQGFAREIENCLDINDMFTARAFLLHITNLATKIGVMLNDLLKLAHLEHMERIFEPVALDKVLSDVKDALAGSIATNQIELVIADNLPTVRGCFTRLCQLFQNLIENSIKFRSQVDLPKIEVGYEETETHWNLFVKDNGIGIAPAHQKLIFGLFKKVDPMSVGSGIGLALVSHIANIHGAQIRIESAGLGFGSTFWLDFPKIV